MSHEGDGDYQEVNEELRLTREEAFARVMHELVEGVAEDSYDIVIEEDGPDWYGHAAKRLHAGAFDIVVVDWRHPNYGYFADGMLWIRSLHHREWRPYPVAGWTKQYKRLGRFLAEFPQFRPLFTDQLT